jgi:hypothetical protein
VSAEEAEQDPAEVRAASGKKGKKRKKLAIQRKRNGRFFGAKTGLHLFPACFIIPIKQFDDLGGPGGVVIDQRLESTRVHIV